jgi:hypothetical protein
MPYLIIPPHPNPLLPQYTLKGGEGVNGTAVIIVIQLA